MSVCDICGTPGKGTLVSASEMKHAVFKNGFDPVELGLINHDAFFEWFGIRIPKSQQYEYWKTNIVFPDQSDWNVCGNCMRHLRQCLNVQNRMSDSVHSDDSATNLQNCVMRVNYVTGTLDKLNPRSIDEIEEDVKLKDLITFLGVEGARDPEFRSAIVSTAAKFAKLRSRRDRVKAWAGHKAGT